MARGRCPTPTCQRPAPYPRCGLNLPTIPSPRYARGAATRPGHYARVGRFVEAVARRARRGQRPAAWSVAESSAACAWPRIRPSACLLLIDARPLCAVGSGPRSPPLWCNMMQSTSCSAISTERGASRSRAPGGISSTFGARPPEQKRRIMRITPYEPAGACGPHRGVPPYSERRRGAAKGGAPP